MDRHQEGRDWLVGQTATLAAIALYAYTHIAEAGGFRLQDHVHVGVWIRRMQCMQGFVPMDCRRLPRVPRCQETCFTQSS